MNEPSKRWFLTGSVVTVAGLTGVVSASEDAAIDASVEPSDVAGAIDLVPADSAIDGEYQFVLRVDVEDVDDESDLGYVDFQRRSAEESDSASDSDSVSDDDS